MRNLLIAAAALAALVLPTDSAAGQVGGHHWRSSPGMHWRANPGMHWQGNRHWNNRHWRGGSWGWRGHHGARHGWNRHVWRGGPRHGWNRHVWRGGPRHGWHGTRHVVIIGGGFGSGFGWGGHAPGCPSLWFDGWGWRCAW